MYGLPRPGKFFFFCCHSVSVPSIMNNSMVLLLHSRLTQLYCKCHIITPKRNAPIISALCVCVFCVSGVTQQTTTSPTATKLSSNATHGSCFRVGYFPPLLICSICINSLFLTHIMASGGQLYCEHVPSTGSCREPPFTSSG